MKIIKEIAIKNKIIGEGRPVFVIAEAGVNHNGRLDLALKLVDAAVAAGADAVKFQTFVVDEGTPKFLDKAEYQKSELLKNESMYQMLKRLELGLDAFIEIKLYCDKKNIIFLSTPCDFKSLEMLDKIGVPAFKIGSGDLTFIPLISKVAKKGKPVIISTGMANLEEVKEAVKAIEAAGNRKIVILQCTTDYPTEFKDANLNVLKFFQKIFDYPIGFSDHTPGLEASIAAVALGAKLVEKHFTLDKNLVGPDHRASIEPSELKALVEGIRKVESAMGDYKKKPTKQELLIAKKVRKSIVAAKNLKKGEAINRNSIKVMKPETGLRPKYFDKIIGRKLNKAKKIYEPILREDLI